jgi:hypothetical protein
MELIQVDGSATVPVDDRGGLELDAISLPARDPLTEARRVSLIAARVFDT